MAKQRLAFIYYKGGRIMYGDHYGMNLLSVDEDGTHRYGRGVDGEFLRMSLLRVGDDWMLHDTKQPAYSTGTADEFYVKGHPHHIEDMPIDDESKLILKLKYAESEYYDS